jgi:hypothetical protein
MIASSSDVRELVKLMQLAFGASIKSEKNRGVGEACVTELSYFVHIPARRQYFTYVYLQMKAFLSARQQLGRVLKRFILTAPLRRLHKGYPEARQLHAGDTYASYTGGMMIMCTTLARHAAVGPLSSFLLRTCNAGGGGVRDIPRCLI